MQFKNTHAAMAAENYIVAAGDILASQYAIDVGQRAKRIANMIVTGSWPDDVPYKDA
jgi:hypothetical protein